MLKTSLSVNVDCHINTLNKPDINGDIEECKSKNKTDNALINFLYRVKSPISEVLSTNYPCRLERIGIKDQFGKSGKANELLHEYKLDKEGIMDIVLNPNF